MTRRFLSVSVAMILLMVAIISQFAARTVSAECEVADCPPTKGTFAFTNQNKLRCTEPTATGPSTPGTGGGGCSFRWTEINSQHPDWPSGGYRRAWIISCVPAQNDPCEGTKWQNPVAGTCVEPTPDPNVPPGGPNGYEGQHCLESGEPGVVEIRMVEVSCQGTDGLIGWKNGQYTWIHQASCMCQGRDAGPNDPSDSAAVCNCKQCSGYAF